VPTVTVIKLVSVVQNFDCSVLLCKCIWGIVVHSSHL